MILAHEDEGQPSAECGMAQTFQADGKQFEDEHENADYSLARQGPVKAGQSRSRLVKVGQGWSR
jgi:hypothetical protein